MKNQTKAYIYALSAVILWSTAASAFKITLRYIEPVELLFLASITAFIALLIFQFFKRNKIQITKKNLLHSALLGFLNPFAYYMILFKAYKLLPAQLAQPLNFIWPLMIVLLSIPILKHKISIRSIISILISFVGVIIISSRGKFSIQDLESPFGIFLALFSSVVWALFFIFNIRDGRNEIEKLLLSFGFGTVYIAIVYALKQHSIPWQGILGSIYIGLFEMGITFVVWIRALKLSRTTAEVNNIIYLTPFLSLIFIGFLVGEQILLSTIFGLILIVLGIIMQKGFRFKRSFNK